MMSIRQRFIFYRGMTMTECLVAVTILGLLAVAVVPSVRLFAKTTQVQDIRRRLLGSWQMAMALAAARQQPVVWQLKPLSSSNTQILLLSHRGEVLWQAQLDAAIRSDIQDSDVASVFERTVHSHGLTDPFALQWKSDQQILKITLGQATDLQTSGGGQP